MTSLVQAFSRGTTPKFKTLWRRSRLWAVARSGSLANLLYGPDTPPELADPGLPSGWLESTAAIVDARTGPALKVGFSRLELSPPVSWDSKSDAKGSAELHAMEYLPVLLERGAQSKDWARVAPALVEDWLQQNPVGHALGWDPEIASRRLNSWLVSYPLLSPQLTADARGNLLAAIAVTARFVAGNLESEVGGLRLASQARALLLASRFMTGSEPAAWRAQAVEALNELLQREVLADGGHVSRSVGVQVSLLRLVLDCAKALEGEDSVKLRAMAEPMLKCTAALARPDGSFPLFARTSTIPELDLPPLRDYAKQLIGDSQTRSDSAVECFPQSGYVVLRLANADHHDHLVVDCGGTEAHSKQQGAGPLSMELSAWGLSFICHSATSEGNTLCFEDRRGHRIDDSLNWGTGPGYLYFQADAMRRRRRHRRSIAALAERAWVLVDEVDKGQARALLECHRDVKLERPLSGELPVYLRRGDKELTLMPSADSKLRFRQPQTPNKGAILEISGSSESPLAVVIATGHRSQASVDIKRRESVLSAELTLDHHEYQLDWPNSAPPLS